MRVTPRLMRAINAAATAHEGQKRKNTGLPFIVHPFAAMAVATEVTDDEDTLIAILLHDVIEDVDPTIYSEEQIRADFGPKVAAIVRAVSKDAALPDWQTQADKYIEQIKSTPLSEALIVCAADKIHNLIATLEDLKLHGEKTWQRFNTNRERQVWWYEAVLDVLQDRIPSNPLTHRLKNLVNQLHAATALTTA